MKNRKFILACFIILFSALALPFGWIDGGAWVAVASLVMTSYGAANVIQKKFIEEKKLDEDGEI